MKGADDGHQKHGNSQRRARAGTARERVVVNQIVEQRGAQNRRVIELFAGDGGAEHRKVAGADDRADAKRRERPGAKRLFQTVLRQLGVADELVNRFGREQLLSQCLGS